MKNKMIRKVDKKNKFVSVFNPDTGFYMRTGVMNENGKDTGQDPFMASFPELLDIGIMGSCSHGQSGLCIKSGNYSLNEIAERIEDIREKVI